MNISSYPNPGLKLKADEVDPLGDKDLKQLVKRMAKAMYAAEGIGLAATQLGVLKRVIVYDIDDRLVALCNPRIVKYSDETAVMEEGCLSVPGVEIPIERPATVTVEAVDLEGNLVVIDAAELLARLFQHEIDHLDGIIILDRATPEERKAAIRAYAERGETRKR